MLAQKYSYIGAACIVFLKNCTVFLLQSLNYKYEAQIEKICRRRKAETQKSRNFSKITQLPMHLQPLLMHLIFGHGLCYLRPKPVRVILLNQVR
jgi:hypothetical protein